MQRLKALDVDASGQMLAKASSCVGGGEYGAFNFSGCRESLRELVGLAVGIQRWTRQSLVAGDCDGAATDRGWPHRGQEANKDYSLLAGPRAEAHSGSGSTLDLAERWRLIQVWPPAGSWTSLPVSGLVPPRSPLLIPD